MKSARPIAVVALVSAVALLRCDSHAWASDPMVTLSATQLRFGTQAQGTSSSPQLVILANIGQADLTITSIVVSGQDSGDFIETSNCPMSPAILAAGGNCEIKLVFHPHTSVTELTAILTIADTASGSPRSVALSGAPTAAVPGITLSPASVGFGNQSVGAASVPQPIVITNSGSATLNLNSAISISGPDAGEFRIEKSANPCPQDSGQLAPRASCEINAIFVPVSAGGKSAQIVIVDDAAGSPHVVSLSGTAITPRQ